MTLKNKCYFTILATIVLFSAASPVLLNKATAQLGGIGGDILPPPPVPVPVPLPLPTNNPPTAADDSAETVVNTSVAIDVLANDSDPDGETVLLHSFDETSEFNGVVTRDDNGTPGDLSDDSLVYTPPTNAFGIDTFSYTITDGFGGFASATVTITVSEDSNS